MGDFEVDTRLESVGGEGRYRAALSEDWKIWGPSGGYLAAILLRAAGCEARIARPISFSCHFLRFARFDELVLRVEVVQSARRTESLRVQALQDDRPVAEALVRTAQPGPGLEHDVARAPDVPGPEALRASPHSDLPFWQNIETRAVWPEALQQERVEPRAPRWVEWYRFRPRATFDDPFLEAGRALLLLDTLTWPAAVQAHVDPDYIAPNLDVSAWFHRGAPERAWLLAECDCAVAEGGTMGTTARVWSDEGQLLASGGAQLLCTPRPGAG